jgi:hypothetical protein
MDFAFYNPLQNKDSVILVSYFDDMVQWCNGAMAVIL